MRKIMLLLLALPIVGYAQNKTVISVDRYFPKTGKDQLFEKAVAAHAQKYHKGDNQWRVYYIETGPDAGGYHIVEGPKTWDGVDKRGNLGDAHMKDWEVTIQPLLTDKISTGYFTFREDLSSTQLGNYSEKISVNHWFFRPGYYGEVVANLQGLKKLWEKDGSTVAVYEASLSGEPQFAIVIRYPNGLKVRDVPNTAAMPVRFSAANGAASWETYLVNMKSAISKQWSELLTHKPEMDSK